MTIPLLQHLFPCGPACTGRGCVGRGRRGRRAFAIVRVGLATGDMQVLQFFRRPEPGSGLGKFTGPGTIRKSMDYSLNLSCSSLQKVTKRVINISSMESVENMCHEDAKHRNKHTFFSGFTRMILEYLCYEVAEPNTNKKLVKNIQWRIEIGMCLPWGYKPRTTGGIERDIDVWCIYIYTYMHMLYTLRCHRLHGLLENPPYFEGFPTKPAMMVKSARSFWEVTLSGPTFLLKISKTSMASGVIHRQHQRPNFLCSHGTCMGSSAASSERGSAGIGFPQRLSHSCTENSPDDFSPRLKGPLGSFCGAAAVGQLLKWCVKNRAKIVKQTLVGPLAPSNHKQILFLKKWNNHFVSRSHVWYALCVCVLYRYMFI